MATISASTSVTHAGLAYKRPLQRSSSHVLGVPAMAKVGKVRCCMERESKSKANMGMGAALLAATMSSPAMALVDERMSTEGTGLPFGLSNNLLGWILLAVFALIWTLYTVYTSELDEDEESGMSL
ncbi:hypothetical protein QN277_012754 [Acacia crassicarpa]|uniref:PSII 6.1 kDa protein n=1 Tax=Acacia crassicarpa TaxID=499986 RepID=A0AAE1N1Q9_9FABA|nr:hypothetical protein QN277_012754 [Acacia crassicarpa]